MRRRNVPSFSRERKKERFHFMKRWRTGNTNELYQFIKKRRPNSFQEKSCPGKGKVALLQRRGRGGEDYTSSAGEEEKTSV